MLVLILTPFILLFYFAVCPGGEGAGLNPVGRKWLAGSNPVCGVVSLVGFTTRLFILEFRNSYGNREYMNIRLRESEFASLRIVGI